jgi:hypothetical protein
MYCTVKWVGGSLLFFISSVGSAKLGSVMPVAAESLEGSASDVSFIDDEVAWQDVPGTNDFHTVMTIGTSVHVTALRHCGGASLLRRICPRQRSRLTFRSVITVSHISIRTAPIQRRVDTRLATSRNG